MHLSLCICSELPQIETRNKLCLVMHRDEVRKPTNTGRLAARCLQGSKVWVHGREGEIVDAPWQAKSGQMIERSLLLYPGDDAKPLGPEHVEEGPVCLVVPDGTWRQAAKMTRRIPWMAALPRVGLPAGGALSSYRLRAEPKEGGLATMEAIARAFGAIEGREVENALYEIFRKMTDRTLYSRGLLAREKVYGGVPALAQRHDPRRAGATGGWGSS